MLQLNFRNSLIFLILSFSVLTFFAKIYPYFPIDLYITRLIQSIDNTWWSQIMALMTLLGNTPYSLISIFVVLIVSLLLNKKLDTLMIIVSTLGAYLISAFFKSLINRPRPDSQLINQLEQFSVQNSFPSGHVLFYMGFFGFLFFLTFTNFRKNLLRTFLLITFALMIVLVGFSRIYRGAHWFSDVLGAYLIGLAWLLIVIHFYYRLKKGVK